MEKIVLNCKECGYSFARSIYQHNNQIKKGKLNFFCSLSCGTKYQVKTGMKAAKEERIKNYYNNPKICPECKGIIDYSKQGTTNYCSQSCAAKSNNKLRVPRISLESICLNCGKSGLIKKFCDSKCSGEFKYKISVTKISNGEKVGKMPLKKYLLETNGQKCQICSTSEWLGKPIMLIMDHIDGNSDNNKLDNLRLICSNCDATTPTYKSRNKGNGRFSRRERYKLNKSY